MDWLTIFSLSGCTLAVFLAFRLIFSRTENAVGAWTFAGFLLCSVLFVIDNACFREGWFERFPALYGVANPFIVASAPLFFLYACAATAPDFDWRKILWLHFLPTVLFGLLEIPVFLAPAEEKIRLARADLVWNGSLLERLGSLGVIDLYLLIYFALAWRRFWQKRERMRESIEEGRSHPLHGMGFFASLLLVINLVSAVLDFTPWGQYGTSVIALSGVIAIFTAFWNITQPGALTARVVRASGLIEDASGNLAPAGPTAESAPIAPVQPTPPTEAPSPTPIPTPETAGAAAIVPSDSRGAGPEVADDETKRLAAKLRRLLETERLYLNADLSLHLLAEQLKTTRHRTSLAIKCAYNTTFYQVIASLRVREAARVLETRKGRLRTIADVAFSSGFNTLSAFNAAFRSEFGETPKAYRVRIPKCSDDSAVS